jgi:hypothetical protein
MATKNETRRTAMRHLGKIIICFCAIIYLCACTADKPRNIPEWKSVYLKLIMDAITETRNLPGVAANYGIELYDIDLDGVPELQECVTVHNNDYSMWFVEGGKARQIIGRVPFEPEWEDMTAFVNLFWHNETSEVVVVHLAGAASFTDEYCFKQSSDKGVWLLENIWSRGSFSIDIPQTKYTRTDSGGVEHSISEQEYDAWVYSILNEYTRLKGDFLSLKECFREYGEAAEAFSLRLKKAPKIISDYFDGYDGIDSLVYMDYELPDITK